MGEEKDGVYCRVCGGIVPGTIVVQQILVDGKPTAINQLDFIIDEVKKLNLTKDTEIKKELIRRAKVLNYIPTKKVDAYADGLFDYFKKNDL